MIEPLRRELSALLPGAFVRRAAGEDALFVTDAPRRLETAARQAELAAMAEAGFCVSVTDNCLWSIDLTEARWRALVLEPQWPMPCAFPAEVRLHAVYRLARLLAAHPAPWPQQPLQPLRAVFKRLDAPQELMRVAPELTAHCARLLRKGQSLPSAAAGPLWLWLNNQMGVEPS